jgi:hypothetical protein
MTQQLGTDTFVSMSGQYRHTANLTLSSHTAAADGLCRVSKSQKVTMLGVVWINFIV